MQPQEQIVCHNQKAPYEYLLGKSFVEQCGGNWRKEALAMQGSASYSLHVSKNLKRPFEFSYFYLHLT